ncbi:MAG: DUF1499 domain-containing protein [Alphaproteobacteria bacterium]|nr:DUF1499 domain-containing protein [Alphaproteobacteria bacterium]
MMADETTRGHDALTMPDRAGTAPSPSVLGHLAGWLTVAALTVLVLSPLGYRVRLLDAGWAMDGFATGLAAAALAVLAGVIGGAVSLASPGRRSGAASSLIYALVSAAALAGALYLVVLPGWDAPPIHDVTTAPDDPPRFDVLRQAHYAGLPYNTYRQYDQQSGHRVSAAYADLRTLVFDRSLRQVFDASLGAARALGWKVAVADRARGHVEAVDAATIFGFRDDIVIRIRLNQSGYTVLDIRSASRIPGSDYGRNAARIRAFAKSLQAHLPPMYRGP